MRGGLGRWVGGENKFRIWGLPAEVRFVVVLLVLTAFGFVDPVLVVRVPLSYFFSSGFGYMFEEPARIVLGFT